MSSGILLDREVLDAFNKINFECLKQIIFIINKLKSSERVITKAFFYKNFSEIRKLSVDDSTKLAIDSIFPLENIPAGESESENALEKSETDSVKLITSPFIVPKKVCVQDFVNHFKSRYEAIKKIFEEKNLENLTSIRKIGSKRESYTIIVAIVEKRITKNKNILLEVEDLTGKASVLINQNKKELFEKAKDLLGDEIVALKVSGSSEMLFANDVIFPDAFLGEKRRHDKDVWAAFISDIHSGSTMFLEENFCKFIDWLNGNVGDKNQKEISKKVRYLFVNGDLVDGVGHFPGQERWLNVLEMKGQYSKLIEHFKRIRDDIKIIIAPGNHDAVWLGEPQPVIGEEWAPDLYKMKNVSLVTNPALVEIEGGFRILMYHGASMHGMINEIEELRLKQGSNTPTKVIKEILKRRHFAPTHGSVDYIPCEKEDALVIKQIPDILTTADLHRHEVSTYNNILLIATSCWQSLTPFQEKVGNHPDFCKVPLFNLKSREVKIIDFFEDKEGEKAVEAVKVAENGTGK